MSESAGLGVTWKQTLAAALIIAGVSAAVVWFLEDFERERVRETMRTEWAAFLAELPDRAQPITSEEGDEDGPSE